MENSLSQGRYHSSVKYLMEISTCFVLAAMKNSFSSILPKFGRRGIVPVSIQAYRTGVGTRTYLHFLLYLFISTYS